MILAVDFDVKQQLKQLKTMISLAMWLVFPWLSQSNLHSHMFLTRSKLQVEDMREIQLANKDATWASDKEATNCKQCEKAFSVARRKVGNANIQSYDRRREKTDLWDSDQV